MIYIYETSIGLEPHTDKYFAEKVMKLGEPLATLTEEEWQAGGGIARIIGGVLVVGKTEPELTQESLVSEAEAAQLKLTESDKFVTKCYDRGLVFSTEYPELYVQREEWRSIIRSAYE